MHKNLKAQIVLRMTEAVAELDITSYEIAKKTTLSELGVAKILRGKVGNPNDSSITAIANCLADHYGVSKEWLFTGAGKLEELKVPLPKEFDTLTSLQKKRKLDEVAVFVAHHEKELMQNPIFRVLVEMIGYQLVIKALKDAEYQGKGSLGNPNNQP